MGERPDSDNLLGAYLKDRRAKLDPVAFGACVAGWMAGVCEATGLRHIAIDGKAVRSAPRSTFRGYSGPHISDRRLS